MKDPDSSPSTEKYALSMHMAHAWFPCFMAEVYLTVEVFTLYTLTSTMIVYRNDKMVHRQPTSLLKVVKTLLHWTDTSEKESTDTRGNTGSHHDREVLYQHLVDHAGVGIATTDIRGRFTFVNEALCTMIGYSQEELLGQPFPTFLHPDDRKDILKIFWDAWKYPMRKPRIEFRVRHKAGHYVDLYSCPTLTLHKGEIIRFNAIILDISKRKRIEKKLKESEEKYRVLYEYAGDAVFTCDCYGNLIDINKIACEHLGLQKEELVGTSIIECGIIHIQDRDLFQSIIQQLIEGNPPIKHDIRFKLTNGTYALEEVTATGVYKEGMVIAITFICRDITQQQQLMNALRDSVEFSSGLLNNAPNPILVINADCSIRYVNPALESLTGYSFGHVVGTSSPFPWWTDHSPDAEQYMEEALEKGIYKVEKLFQKKNGNNFWVEVTTVPVYIEGELKYSIANWVDITDRKNMEHEIRTHAQELKKRVAKRTKEVKDSEKKFRHLIEYANDAIFIADTHGTIIEVNKKSCEFTGYTREELLSKKLIDFVKSSEREKNRKMFAQVEEGISTENFETTLIRKDGTAMTILLNMVMSEFSGERIIQGIARDITQRKIMEKERESYIKALEKLNEKLAEADKLKTQFLATMSHELRTPLNSIIGFTDIILAGMSGPISEEVREQLEIVSGSSKHLLNLINDILDLSRIESGKLELILTTFTLEDIIQEVVRIHSPMAKEKSLQLSYDLQPGLPSITNDKTRIKQILMNLVNNAIKYTHEGSVSLEARLSRNNQLVHITVRDTGIGISQENVKDIFQAFKQLDSGSTRRYEGAGLGLYLSKKLVDLLGGEISVESEKNKGSVFVVSFPVSYEKS
jgi:PAS domain S-box-containing protein